MQQLFFVFQMAKMVARPQKRLQLIAGARTFLMGKREAERFFPASAPDGGDLHVLDRARRGIFLGHLLHAINDDRDVAEADDIMRPYRSEERRVGKECRSRWS